MGAVGCAAPVPVELPGLTPDCVRTGGRRLKALYFFGFGVYGCFTPYLYLFCRDTLGFSDTQVGVLGSLLPLMRIVSPPIWGAASDAVRNPRYLIASIFLPSMAAMTLLLIRPGFAGAVGLMGVFAFFHAPAVAMIDGATFKHIERTGQDYSRLRLWGSIGFIMCTIGSGLPMYLRPDLRWFFALLVPCSVVSIYAALRVPDCPPRRPGKVGLRGFVMFKRFPVAVLTFCSFLSWAAMAAYYTFFSHYLVNREVPLPLIGSVWALGTFFESFVFYYAQPILRWMGIKGLLALGLGGVVTRLGILSLTPAWPVVLCSQTLHALTLSAVHIAGVTYINRESPDHLRSSAQGIFCAIGIGLGSGLGSISAGWLRQIGTEVLMLRAHALFALFALVVLLVGFRVKRQAADGQEERRPIA